VTIELVADIDSSGDPDARTLFVVSPELSLRLPFIHYKAPFECVAFRIRGQDDIVRARCTGRERAYVTQFPDHLVIRRPDESREKVPLPPNVDVFVSDKVRQAPAVAHAPCAPGTVGPTLDVVFASRRGKPDPQIADHNFYGELRTLQLPWTLPLFVKMPWLDCRARAEKERDGNDAKMIVRCHSIDIVYDFEASVRDDTLVVTSIATDTVDDETSTYPLARVQLPCGARIRPRSTP
jgi:hypothetical protein